MDVNNFGIFNADVWGTVSDWVVVFGTILTIIYLIMTFEKQKSLYNIEKERYRNSKKPIFNVEIVDAPYKKDSDFFLKLINTQNVARQVEFQSVEYYEHYSFQDQYFSHESASQTKKGDKIGYGKNIGDLIPNEEFIIKVKLYEQIAIEFFVFFSLKFYDESSETQYIQYFIASFTNGKTGKKIPEVYKKGMPNIQSMGYQG